MPLTDREEQPLDTQPSLFSEQGRPKPVVKPPSIADDTERSLDPRSITLERIGRGIFTAVFAGMSLIGVAILLLQVSPGMLGGLAILAGWALLIAGLAALAWFWPPVRHHYIAYRVNETGIRIRRGVVWRSVITVPRSRVQHTDVSQGPIERGMGLASLIIHTAGTQNASVSLGGLRYEDALQVRDYLIDVDERDTV
jgi:membrane protein YdbS with pleckstrin-like domain